MGLARRVEVLGLRGIVVAPFQKAHRSSHASAVATAAMSADRCQPAWSGALLPTCALCVGSVGLRSCRGFAFRNFERDVPTGNSEPETIDKREVNGAGQRSCAKAGEDHRRATDFESQYNIHAFSSSQCAMGPPTPPADPIDVVSSPRTTARRPVQGRIAEFGSRPVPRHTACCMGIRRLRNISLMDVEVTSVGTIAWM